MEVGKPSHLSNAICTSSEVTKLPPEIISQIIKACVEPYDLQVHPTVYNTCDFPYDVVNKHHWWREYRPRSFTEPSWTEKMMIAFGDRNLIYPFMGHRTTLIANGLLKPATAVNNASNGLEYVSGIPDPANIKLVCKMFYDEVSNVIQQSFTGKVFIQDKKQFFQGARRSDWTPTCRVHKKEELTWLRPLITQLFVRSQDDWESMTTVLSGSYTPNLDTITIQVYDHFESNRRIDPMSAEHTIALISKNASWCKAVLSPILGMLRARNTRILIDVEFNQLGSGKIYKFIIDVSSEEKEGHFIEHRQSMN